MIMMGKSIRQIWVKNKVLPSVSSGSPSAQVEGPGISVSESSGISVSEIECPYQKKGEYGLLYSVSQIMA